MVVGHVSQEVVRVGRGVEAVVSHRVYGQVGHRVYGQVDHRRDWMEVGHRMDGQVRQGEWPG